MRYAIFGDESTIPGMRSALGDSVSQVVVASRRSTVDETGVGGVLVQPPRGTAKYAAFVSQLAESRPDAILCFSYSMILDQDVLELPAMGAINIHGGLLPRYRGANVLNWAIIEGAAQTGVTAHFMTTGIDEGDIVYQEATPITEDDTAVTLKARLDAIGLSMVRRIDAEFRAGRALPRRPQDSTHARYYRRRRPEDGRIDWKAMSDREVFNLVRGLVRPWPGAYFVDSSGTRMVLDRFHTLSEISALRNRYA